MYHFTATIQDEMKWTSAKCLAILRKKEYAVVKYISQMS